MKRPEDDYPSASSVGEILLNIPTFNEQSSSKKGTVYTDLRSNAPALEPGYTAFHQMFLLWSLIIH
jgi:hypothetical protein